MSKPASERTYKKQLEQSRGNVSPEQVRASKNARCKARREQRRVEPQPKLPPAEQLKTLDYRLGPGVGAQKERKRLAASLS